MARLPFIKMHGAGNDYVFVDGFETQLPDTPEKLAVAVSDRHFGIGSDGLILMLPPDDEQSDVRMRMWNSDGSVGAMCGNGTRCVALWMYLRKRVRERCRIRTLSRVVTATLQRADTEKRFGTIIVDMGRPQFVNDRVRSELRNLQGPLPQGVVQSSPLQYTPVSMGNPHAVIFGHELTDRTVHQVGAAIQRHEAFPDGVNVEWVEVKSETELAVRVLERGTGETLACGSGACAAVVAAVLCGYCQRDSEIGVLLPGGRLTACWRQSGTVLLTGPATVSFEGEWPLDG